MALSDTARARLRELTARPLAVGAALEALFVLPLLVAVTAFNRPRWLPIADLAQTELRVRDVGSSHTPLVGLAGRIGTFAEPGSHPGPLSFWLLTPVYRLLGSSATALTVATVVIHAVAVGLVLWLAHRRGGIRMMVAVGAMTLVVARAYGPVVLLEPWNPYLPVMAWLVVLIAVWSVLDDDPPALVVAVAAGSLCAQTHLPYLALVGGMGGVALLGAAWWIWRGRPDDEPNARRRRLRWLLIAIGVGLALWLPPIADQVNDTGNVTKILDTLLHSEDEPAGVRLGVEEVLGRFGLSTWITPQDTTAEPAPDPGIDPGGLLALLVWGAAAALSLTGRAGPAALGRLHLTVAAATLLGLVAATRVTGDRWFYLYLWTVGVAAVALLATAWTASAVIATRLDAPARARLRAAVVPVATVVAVVASASLAFRAATVEPSEHRLVGELRSIAADTDVALRSGEMVGGSDGRYLVRWVDPVTLGSRGIGLVNELERDGFDVGIDEAHRVGGTRRRVMSIDEADAVLMVAVGEAAIEDWRARDGAQEIAYVDRRSDAQRAEAEAISTRIDAALVESGHADRVESWRGNVFTTAIDLNLPAEVRSDVRRLLDLGFPVAVFAVDPAAA